MTPIPDIRDSIPPDDDHPFPEDGTEDDKNRWAADEIYEWEGGRLCPVCGNRREEIHAGYWWCHFCDDAPDIYYGADDPEENGR